MHDLPASISPSDQLESPVLMLGLVGFTPQEQQVIGAAVAEARAGGVQWRLGEFGRADAWLVNGARTQLLPDDTLRVASGREASPVRFRLPEVDRPIAFSEPLRPEIEPACRFRLDQVGSIHAVLGRFVQWLRPLVAQLCLASQLVERRSELVWPRIYHVTSCARLLAVVDLQGQLGVLPAATPAHFAQAQWELRPASARYVPENFAQVTLPVLLWQYAARTQRGLLPERYRAKAIHYRRPPEVPHRLMSDSQLLLLRELAQGTCTFDDLEHRTGLMRGRLARELGALYVTGSITTDPARARRSQPVQCAFNPDATGALHLGGVPSGPLPLVAPRALAAAAAAR